MGYSEIKKFSSNITTLREIVLSSAFAAIGCQRLDGSFPPGQNGPWNNIDTPVRVTAHWCILFLKVYELTGNTVFRNVADSALTYLTSKSMRPGGYSFRCIDSDSSFIQCNGLIGQAWANEALIVAAQVLGNSNYASLAEEIILKHQFNKRLCLWHVLGVNGEVLGIQKSFNQQLWFAVMALKVAGLCNNREIERNIALFVDRLPYMVKKNAPIFMKINEWYCLRYGDYLGCLKLRKINSQDKNVYKRSMGYLAFSLVGFAMLYELMPSHDVWRNNRLYDVICKSVDYLDEVIYDDDENEYGFPYNPIGFETAYVKEVFINYLSNCSATKCASDWVSKQISNHYDFKSMQMKLKTSDMNTFSARLYEATKLKGQYQVSL